MLIVLVHTSLLTWHITVLLSSDQGSLEPLSRTQKCLVHDIHCVCTQVRRRAQEVMEAVLRGGVMPPFSAIPTLFALATDPNRYPKQ